jgi:hypothetical protein
MRPLKERAREIEEFLGLTSLSQVLPVIVIAAVAALVMVVLVRHSLKGGKRTRSLPWYHDAESAFPVIIPH